VTTRTSLTLLQHTLHSSKSFQSLEKNSYSLTLTGLVDCFPVWMLAAVGVSSGSDFMALCVLTVVWKKDAD
jgi:hypothetical protein